MFISVRKSVTKMIYEYETVKKYFRKNSAYIFQTVHQRELSKVYHSHDFYEWIVLLIGSCTQKVNDKIFEMTENSCVLLCPGDSHSFLLQSMDMHIMSLSVERTEHMRWTRLFGLNDDQLKFTYITPDASQAKMLAKLNTSDQEYEYKQILANLIAIYIKSSEKNDIPAALRLAMNEMNKTDNLRGGADRFAELSHYSRSHLNRLMKKYFNTGLHEYIRDTRLERAYNLLVLSSVDAETLAESLGYSSFSHFNRIFKEKYGMTPAAVRKKHGLFTI